MMGSIEDRPMERLKIHLNDYRSANDPKFAFYTFLAIMNRRPIINLPGSVIEGEIQPYLATKVREIHLFKHMIPRKGGMFIDIGANFGCWTFHLAKQGIQVHAFEPGPRPYRQLAKEAKSYKNVHLYRCALGDRSHRSRMMIHRGSGHNSIVSRGSDFVGISIPVSVETLDSFDFRNVGLIKIDTEGYEVPILRGSRETIVREKPRLIVEVHRPFEKEQSKIMDYFKALDYRWIIKRKRSGQPHLIADHEDPDS